MPAKKTSAPIVVVTGAGSGVGRATALKFCAEGWRVVLLGRRPETLTATIQLAPARQRRHLWASACDLADPTAITCVTASVLARFGRVDVLINAAGQNIPRRALSDLSPTDYAAVMDANINGVLLLVQAFLPVMRTAGTGTIINIGSEAGRQASPKSGAAYVISKFGLTGLTQSINAEERPNGIRACCIFPGDINTAILDKRPVPPSPEARSRMMLPEDIAACAWFAASLPARATVEEILIRPSRPWTG